MPVCRAMVTSHAARVRRHGRRQQDPDHGRFPTVYNQEGDERTCHTCFCSRPLIAEDDARACCSARATIGFGRPVCGGLADARRRLHVPERPVFSREAHLRAGIRPRARRGKCRRRSIITPTRGLLTPETPVTVDLLREFAGVDVAADDERYRLPLERDLARLSAELPAGSRVVLLGSIASDKYVSRSDSRPRTASALSALVHRPGRHEPRWSAAPQRTSVNRARLPAARVRHGAQGPSSAEACAARAVARDCRRRSLRLERVL